MQKEPFQFKEVALFLQDDYFYSYHWYHIYVSVLGNHISPAQTTFYSISYFINMTIVPSELFSFSCNLQLRHSSFRNLFFHPGKEFAQCDCILHLYVCIRNTRSVMHTFLHVQLCSHISMSYKEHNLEQTFINIAKKMSNSHK